LDILDILQDNSLDINCTRQGTHLADFKTIHFENLEGATLYVDALYKGGVAGNAGDDPISKLIGTGNQGGFRYVGPVDEGIKLCVLYSSLTELDWPDRLDPDTGRFIYYGDNRRPGHELHDTRRKGNEILRQAFNNYHSGNRHLVPPFFIFTKGPEGRDVFFRGLAVPGAMGLTGQEDLVAVWKSITGQRFQNYRSIFTILDESVISPLWITDIRNGNRITSNTPTTWLEWVEGGVYNALVAPRVRAYRTKDEQLPSESIAKQLISQIISYFKDHPRGEYAFEECAAEIALLMDANITDYDLTRPWRDGGRDVLGKYRIGHNENSIVVEFALEAKCKYPESGSGIRETSRLISRLRHRQFGIFLTTSYVSEQAYKEILEDKHPVIIISGIDIATIMLDAGYTTPSALLSWLRERFPYEIDKTMTDSQS